jgi:hypothetical protein
MILKNIIPTSTWTAIRAYFNNLFVITFNNGSAASGDTDVTLNAKSGILEFTAFCNAGAYLDLILANSYVDANTPMWFTLCYDTADLGLPSILYVTKSSGNVIIRVYNSSISDATNGNIKIDFQIMN